MARLPDTIPTQVGTLIAPVAPVSGSGWEVFVVSHADYYTRIAQIPKWTSLTFAKILKDKGSATVVIPMDDASLFPQPPPPGLNDNPFFLPGKSGVRSGSPVTGELLSSNDQIFATGLGTWAANTGTLTWDNSLPVASPMQAGNGAQLAGSGTISASTGFYAVLPNVGYQFRIFLLSLSAGRVGTVNVSWYDNTHTLISTSGSGTATDNSSAWTQCLVQNVASPANAAFAKVSVSWASAAENHFFAGASFSPAPAGWTANGGVIGTYTAQVVDHPATAILTPNGTATQAQAKESGKTFACYPLQQYVVSGWLWSAIATTHAQLGIDFRDQSGNIVLEALSSGLSLNATTWTRFTATFQCPAGAYVANPLFGVSGTPVPAAQMLAQDVAVTYESGSTTTGDLILDYEHLIQIWEDGVLRFDWVAETVTEQLADSSEQRLATITGPGTIATLGWALALPPGFPAIIFKCDSIQDGFAEIDQFGDPALDVTLWNLAAPLSHISLNPLGTVQLVASPSTTYLGSSAYDITSSSVSAQVSPLTGRNLDGSQVTQFYVQDVNNSGNYALIGLTATAFYCQVGDSAGGKTATKKLPGYDQNNHAFWRISEDGAGSFVFWTSADGVNWLRQWTIPHRWNPVNLKFFFSAHYDADNSVSASMTSLNSDIITPSSAGNIFLNTPVMSMWFQLFTQAQQRGTIPWITTRMNASQDSFGNPWTDGMSAQVGNGTDLYSLLQSQAGIVNADWIMQPGFNLQVGLPVQPAAISLGLDKSLTVVARESQGVTQRQRVRARDKVANSVGAVNSDGRVVTGTDANSIIRYWQREGWVQTAQAVNPADIQVVVSASVAATRQEELTATVSIAIGTPGAPRPFTDFDCGDWIGLERANGASVVEKVRVVGITVSVDADGNASCDLTIYTWRQFMQAQLQYLVNKFGGQFIYSLGTVPVTFGTSGTGTPPTYIAPQFQVNTH